MRFLLTTAWIGLLGAWTQAGVIYVDADATGTGDGTSWRHACTSVADGIARARSGDELWVAEGTYGPIALKSGLVLVGGFTGTESYRSEADPEAHRTIIDGSGTDRAVTSIDNGDTTEVRGFVIRNGAALDPGKAGGGAYLRNSDAIFVRCEFTENTSTFAGGAVANYGGGQPAFVNCRFHDNGGVDGRATPVGGGAVFNHDGAPRFINSLFYGNKAQDGGAIVSLDGAMTIINCTLTDNEATNRRGGAIFDNVGEAVVRNSIVWSNRAAVTDTAGLYNHANAARRTDIAYTNVQGGWAGDGNLDTDPLFVDAANHDFSLKSDSPCRDRGSNTALPQDIADLGDNGDRTETLPRDMVLQGRIEGSSVDMGAFERRP